MAAASARVGRQAETVLVISLSDVRMDARILRQVEFLTDDYHVVLAAPGHAPQSRASDFIELVAEPTGKVGRVSRSSARFGLRMVGSYGQAYWLDPRIAQWREALRRALPVSAIVVNDLWALPLARSLDPTVPIVFDSHEHWTSESASWSARQRLSMRHAHEWIVDRYVPSTAGTMTVSRGIAEAYEQRLGRRPELVTNAPFYRELEPSPVQEPIRLIHLGVADERRRLEDTIEAVRSLGDRFALDLVLARDSDYRRRLEEMVAGDRQCRVLPPVPVAEVIPFANAYDVGVFLLPARFPNQVHVLPNKLFDYIQARLAVAIGPSPEMARVVRDWECGVISESFTSESFAAALGGLTVERVEQMKLGADRAAAVLNADSNRETVVALVSRAIARD
jgi:glycosyltransferase involved in cell wall biosynthesis